MRWFGTDIEIVKIDGELYALHGWNGEVYGDCWKCIDRYTAAPGAVAGPGDLQYVIAPIYDWDNFDYENDEFPNGSDGIIGYEIRECISRPSRKA